LLSSIGLFQTYWHGSVLAGGGHSESDVAWIISVFGFLDCLFAAPAGILFDRGHGWLLPLGCAVYVVAWVGLACSRTYAQFMGCMAVAGVAAGGYSLVHTYMVYRDSSSFFLFFSFSFLFASLPGSAGRLTRSGFFLAAPTTIAFSVVSQWFDARKGTATGCVTLGAPLGGIFFSLVLQTLFGRYPWRTAALVLVGIMAGLLVVGNLLVETNVLLPPPAGRQTASEDDPSERRPAEATISNMLRSAKFWLVSYALFGKPCRSTKLAVSFC
jgi:hypothetical protein